MNPTRPHKHKKNNKDVIKIGKFVPEGAINLAYFHNKRSQDGDENIIVSEAPKSSIDHMTITDYINKYCVSDKDNDIFPDSIYHLDNNGYDGDLQLVDIKWYDHLHNFEKDVTIKKEYEDLTERIVPNSLDYSEKHESGITMSGALGNINVEWIPVSSESAQEEVVEKKLIRRTHRTETMTTINYNAFPSSIPFNADGFTGTLNLVTGSSRFIPSFSDSQVRYYSGSQNGEASTMTVSGIILPRLETINSTQQVTTYGVCRYWGPYSTGVYDASQGRFSDNFPAAPGGAFAPNQIRGMSRWGCAFYPNGSNWRRDYDAPRRYANTWSGWLWAESVNFSDLYSRYGSPSWLANKVGTSGIKPDYIFGNTIYYNNLTDANTNGNTIGWNGSVDSMKYLYNYIWKGNGRSANRISSYLGSWVRARGATATSTQYYFRDCIGFFTGTFGGKTSKYGKNVITANAVTYKGEADYQGVVVKKTTKTNSVTNKWKAIVTYSGTIKGSYVDYNGIAKYTGTVTRKNTVGNSVPVKDSVKIMYPSNDGYLFEDIFNNETCKLQSELFEITDMFKDGEPLFYSCRLQNLVYDSTGPNEFGLCAINPIKLINSRNKEINSKFKYEIKLIKGPKPNAYYCDLYTSFKTNSNNKVYALYPSCGVDENDNIVINANTKERIFVQPQMQKGTDFLTETITSVERINKIKINNPLVIIDSRKKIEFEYEIVVYRNHEVLCVSNPIRTKAINYKYSLDNEKPKFIGRDYIISPESKAGFQTAREIISTKFVESLEDVVFVARLTSNDINLKIKDKVNLNVDSEGRSYVTAEIFEETGFESANGEFTSKLKTPGKYIVFENKIRCAYAVKCLDRREIKLLHPKNKNLLESWYTGIQFGFFTQLFNFRGIKRKLVYSLPEFDTQEFSIYGRPYVFVEKEKATYIDQNTIKVKNSPLYVRLNSNKIPVNLVVTISNQNKEKNLTVSNWSYEEGIVFLKEIINENDNINVSYYYQEDRYIYKGYFDKNDFVGLDINTNMYHKYTDTSITPHKIEESFNLFNKTIYYFIKPSLVVEKITEEGELIYDYKEVERFITSDREDNFPETLSVEENSYFGEIPKVGVPSVQEGSSGGEVTQEIIKYLNNSNIGAFPENIEILENGFSGIINKTGVPFVVEGEYIEFLKKDFEKEVISNSVIFENHVAINEDGYSGNIPKVGEPVVISGEIEDDLVKECTHILTGECDYVFPESFYYEEEGLSGNLLKFGDPILISGILLEEETRLVSRDLVYETEEEIPDSISFEEEGVSGVLVKTNIEKEIIGYSQVEGEIIKTIAYYDIENKYDSEEKVPLIFEYNYDEFEGTLDLEYVDEIIEEGVTCFIGAYTGSVRKVGLVDDLDNPIRGDNFVATFEAEMQFPKVDTRVWEQTYKAVLTKIGSDTRQWVQLYKGTLSKEGIDTRVWRQKYSGHLTKNIGDTRLWKQRYYGEIKKEVSSITAIEVFFLIDRNEKMNNVVKNMLEKIYNIHKGLKDSSIQDVKIGIGFFSDGKVQIAQFENEYFTNDISLILNKIEDEKFIGSSSNSFDGVIKTSSIVPFTTESKNIVLFSNNGTSDIELLYNASNSCNEKHINVHVVTDTYNYLCKMLTGISSETRGTVAEFVNDWDMTLLSAISRICMLGSIKMYNKETIYHKIDNEIPNSKNDLYVGSVFIRHYTSLQATQIIDSRVLGGGVIRNMQDSIRKELEPESDYYFDIGYWDGEPYNENGVVVFRLDKRILKENGGNFSEIDVEIAIKKWLASGIIPIIEYVSSDNLNEIINEKLIISQNNTNNFNYKPEVNGESSEIVQLQ